MDKEPLVYVIDDNEVNLFVYRKVMEKVRFSTNIYTFNDTETALESLQNQAPNIPYRLPDIIFLDIHVPSLKSWGFLDLYKNIFGDKIKETLIFIISSSIDKKEKKRAVEHELVTDFFEPPLNEQHINKIRNLLQEKWAEI